MSISDKFKVNLIVSKLACAICCFLIFVVSANACPKINALIDANCDGKIKIAIFGDSIVRGVMDTGVGSEDGGYLKFLEKTFPKATFINGGIPGIDSRALFRAFIKNAPKQGKTYMSLQDADLVMIGVGINDYWLKVPAQATVRNIARTRNYIKNFSLKEFGFSPHTMTISVTNTLRVFQQPWVQELNTLIYANSAKIGPIVPFNKLAAELVVSDDALHPDELGYMRLADIAAYSLIKSYNKLAKPDNKDSDKDGVADLAEIQKFFTDPNLQDTDGDTLKDGLEIFRYFTNPLAADSDQDGVDDATEIANGSDPLPAVTPTAIPTTETAPSV